MTMKTVYEPSNGAEAHMLADLLRQQGIEAQILGEHLQGAIGELPAAGLVRLAVAPDDYAAARAFIGQWENAEKAQQPAPRQATARQRGLLWFLCGLALGVGGMYAAFRMPVRTDGIDHNRDGVVDEKWLLSPADRTVMYEIDRNFDGKVDHVVHFDIRGQMDTSESDNDFDGVFETRMRYRQGNPAMSQSDTDGDGYPELHFFYRHGVLDTMHYLDRLTGRPLRVEHFRLDRLVFADIDADRDGTLETRVTYTALGEVAGTAAIPKQ